MSENCNEEKREMSFAQAATHFGYARSKQIEGMSDEEISEFF